MSETQTAIPAQTKSFEAWMVDLEAIMDDWGAKHQGRPYGDPPLAETTGLECWRELYDDGYSAQDAFDEDQTYWE